MMRGTALVARLQLRRPLRRRSAGDGIKRHAQAIPLARASIAWTRAVQLVAPHPHRHTPCRLHCSMRCRLGRWPERHRHRTMHSLRNPQTHAY
eukprot:365173-Chlamydomonas_euryale.AAC.4